MAEPKTISHLPGEDPGTVRANAEYQEALQKMLMSLDSRKNRMFDPTLLAMAEGFLKPAPTFGESLGNVAGGLRAAQEKQALEDQKLAEARLGLAGKGLELERQKARERAFEQLARVGAPAAGEAPAEASGAVPSSVPGQPSAPMGAGQVAQSVAQAGAGRLAQGVQIAPPDPSFPTLEQFLAAQRLDPSVNAGQAMLKWQELLKGAEVVTEGGVFNRATGRFYSKPGGAPVERKIFDRTFLVSPVNAARLDMAQGQGGDHYKNVATQVLKEMQGADGTAPRDVTESKIEEAGSLEREKTLQAGAAKKELSAPERFGVALEIKSAAHRMMEDVRLSPRVFGLMSHPGIAQAIGTFIDEGLQLGSYTAKLPGFREGLARLVPGATPEDINALARFAGARAQLELYLRRIYFGGQGMGATSDMETAIIPRVIGSEKDSPEAIRDKLQLLSLRAQHEMKEVHLWNEMSKVNPKLTYLQFEKSDQYADLKKKYEAALSEAFLRGRPAAASGSSVAPVQPAGARTAAPGAASPSAGSTTGSASTGASRQQGGAPRYPNAARAAQEAIGGGR